MYYYHWFFYSSPPPSFLFFYIVTFLHIQIKENSIYIFLTILTESNKSCFITTPKTTERMRTHHDGSIDLTWWTSPCHLPPHRFTVQSKWTSLSNHLSIYFFLPIRQPVTCWTFLFSVARALVVGFYSNATNKPRNGFWKRASGNGWLDLGESSRLDWHGRLMICKTIKVN